MDAEGRERERRAMTLLGEFRLLFRVTTERVGRAVVELRSVSRESDSLGGNGPSDTEGFFAGMPEMPKNVTENKVVGKDRERSIEEADVGTESQTSAQKRVIRLPSRRFRAGLFIPFAFLSSIPIPQPARSPVFLLLCPVAASTSARPDLHHPAFAYRPVPHVLIPIPTSATSLGSRRCVSSRSCFLHVHCTPDDTVLIQMSSSRRSQRRLPSGSAALIRRMPAENSCGGV